MDPKLSKAKKEIEVYKLALIQSERNNAAKEVLFEEALNFFFQTPELRDSFRVKWNELNNPKN